MALSARALARATLLQPGHAEGVLTAMLSRCALPDDARVCEIGAGSGRLSRQLALRGLNVLALEPQRTLSRLGRKRTAGLSVRWETGRIETHDFAPAAFDLAIFANSFELCEPQATLAQCRRLLKPDGWLACLWTQRDTRAALPAALAELLGRYLPPARGSDPTAALLASPDFGPWQGLAGSHRQSLPTPEAFAGWRAHPGLQRLPAADRRRALAEIRLLLGTGPYVTMPYTTRILFARRL